jgi:transcriptional regulator with PAS, ATPase and Fis domain
MEKITTSKKVEFALKNQGRNKTWLAKELGISRPSLYQRLSDNVWQNNELIKLKSIGLI